MAALTGYLDEEEDLNGTLGTSVLVSQYQYFPVTDGQTTIYPVANYTTAGDNGLVTTYYEYAWYSGTLQSAETVTTLPPVTTGQNGPGGATGTATRQFFDQNSSLTWAIDAGVSSPTTSATPSPAWRRARSTTPKPRWR